MWLFLAILGYFVWKGYEEMNGKLTSLQWLKWSMAFFALFVGMGDMLGGYDRYIYAEIFDEIADYTDWGLYQYWRDSTLYDLYASERFYCWLNIIMSFFTRNRYVFILLFTVMIYIFVYYAFKKYATYYALAVIVLLGFWWFFTFTYLRQVLAVAIAWNALPYVEKKDWQRFTAVVVTAFLFHNSAIVLFPIYFIPLVKLKKEVLWKVVVAVFIIGITGLPSALFDVFGAMTDSIGRTSGYSQNSGAQWTYIAESVVIMYFIYKNYDNLFQTPRMTLMTNMAILFCLLLVLFFKSENGGRICWYYLIGVIVTLSNLMGGSWQTFARRIAILVICCALFYRVLTAWGRLGILYPYTTMFHNGPRTWDLSWTDYEYDHNYDKDKFYR